MHPPRPLMLPPLADIPLHVLAIVAAVVLVGYTIFGATGFGSNIITIPTLAHFFPLTFIVPLCTATDSFAATSTALRLRKLVAWRVFVKLLPAMAIGMTLGASLLLNLPRAPALLALGLFAGAYGVYVLAGPRTLRFAPDWLVWPIGAVGGVFSALFGSGGPIYMVFLSARIHDKSSLRATSALVVAVSVWVRLLLFTGTGLLINPTLVTLALLLLPVMAVGLYLGNRLHHGLSGAGVLRLIAVVLLVNGVALVVRALQTF
jgi:uncharacterized membrane protein YfcA